MSDWQEERLRRGDDLRLQMALEESRREKSKPEEVRVLRIESKSVFTSMSIYISNAEDNKVTSTNYCLTTPEFVKKNFPHLKNPVQMGP